MWDSPQLQLFHIPFHTYSVFYGQPKKLLHFHASISWELQDFGSDEIVTFTVMRKYNI